VTKVVALFAMLVAIIVSRWKNQIDTLALQLEEPNQSLLCLTFHNCNC